MQYLGGYILHSTVTTSQKSELSESQQAISFFKARKADKNFAKISQTFICSFSWYLVIVMSCKQITPLSQWQRPSH